MPWSSPASIAVSGLTPLKRRATAGDIAATAALRCQRSSRGWSSPFSESTFFSCDIANAMAALRTMLKPMRAMAVRSSEIGLPVKLMAAELAICISRAASAGSEPTTRTTLSCVTCSSASTWRTRSAMSGKLGRSTLPFDSSAASACTKAKASGSPTPPGEFSATELVIIMPSSFVIGASCARLRPPSSNWFTNRRSGRIGEAPALAGDVHGVRERENLAGDALQRHDVIGRPERDRLAGHSPNHTRRLVLGDRPAAAVAHLLQPSRAVLAHSREQQADGVAAGALCHRAEQHIDRRLVPVDGNTVIQAAYIPGAVAHHHEVTIARRDVGMACEHVLAILRLADRHRTAIV